MIKATIPRERAPKDEDDVKAILKSTKVNINVIKKRARNDNALSILRIITAETPSQKIWGKVLAQTSM